MCQKKCTNIKKVFILYKKRQSVSLVNVETASGYCYNGGEAAYEVRMI